MSQVNYLEVYKKQMAKLQEQNANYQRMIYQMMDYVPDTRLEWEINSLKDKIVLNSNHLKILRSNIIAIKTAQGQLKFNLSEAIESINIIQDVLEKQITNSKTAKYYIQDYDRLEHSKEELHILLEQKKIEDKLFKK